MIIGKGKWLNPRAFGLVSVTGLMLKVRFWGIFWIDASSYITAQQGFLEISRTCGVEEDPKAVRQWLSNIQDPWLLIIDNADDPSLDVSDFFPTGNRGSILLTTRNPDCKIHSTVGSCELGQLNMDEAVTLLLKAAGAEVTADEDARRKAKPVIQTLGFLALAITQAGAYIRRGLCSIEEYCDVYTRRRQKMLMHRSVQANSDYKYSVYTTWEISIEAIEKRRDETSHNAMELLRVFGFLHYDGITEDIFEQAWRNNYRRGDSSQDIIHMFYMQPQQKAGDWDPTMIREAADLLASFSLINLGRERDTKRIDETGRRMSMHPLVHVWARDRLSEELQRCSWIITSSTLAATMSWEYALTDFRFRRSLLPHIESCISLCRDKPFLDEYSGLNRVSMAEKFAIAFHENGRLHEAMELQETVLEARQRTLGSEHPDTLRTMNSLAISYSDLGRKQEAMELNETVLKAHQRTLGSEHLDTLRTMNNLAADYSDLGRKQEAMKLNETVVKARQRTLGSEHPDTLCTMNNLANSYSDLGRKQEAMKLNEKVLKARQRTLKIEYPDTLNAMNGLANSYSDLGRKQEAIELNETVLKACQRTLGSEHPGTLRTMNNLALSYSDLGRKQEAMELEETVLKAHQRTLGSEHPDTLRTMNNLALSYSDFGRKQEAMKLNETVVKARQRTLGSEHPDTLCTMNNLANSYSDLGRKQEAMELNETVLKARQRTQGSEHPVTLNAMTDLAFTYSGLGRKQEAIELNETVLKARQRTLGSEHPDTLRTMKYLALNYSDLGRKQEAMELNETVLKARQRTLGSEHPDTLKTMNSLAINYSDLGRKIEAIKLIEETLKASRKTLGSEHSTTLLALDNLAKLKQIEVEIIDNSKEVSQQTLKLYENTNLLKLTQSSPSDEHPQFLLTKSARRTRFRRWLRRI